MITTVTEREGRHTETVRGERQPIPDYFRNSDGGWTALSWSGFNVLGNSASIDAVKKAVHAQQYVENVRDELTTLRSERDAATSAHDDLVAALRTISDMAGTVTTGTSWGNAILAARAALAKAGAS